MVIAFMQARERFDMDTCHRLASHYLALSPLLSPPTDGGKTAELYGLLEGLHRETLAADREELLRACDEDSSESPFWNCLLYTSPSPRDRG